MRQIPSRERKRMVGKELWHRRGLLAAATTTGAALVGLSLGDQAAAEPAAAAVIPPTEELMYEHGVLKRVLLVYDETLRRIHSGEDLPAAPVHQAAQLVRGYIEDFHEHLEEQYVFHPLYAAHQLTGIVRILCEQHKRGRVLTRTILDTTHKQTLSKHDRQTLMTTIEAFNKMYGPHEAWEDTVVYPALRKIMPGRQFCDLGQRFADEAHHRFGPHGLADMVRRVSDAEKDLGIYGLR